MKKYMSVLGLIARSSIYIFFALLIFMFSVESVFFIIKFPSADQYNYYFARFEECVVNCGVPYIFAFCFIVVTVLLCLTGIEHSSKTGYTLRRLAVKEEGIFVIQAFYNILVYIAFWALQLCAVYFLSFYYLRSAPKEYVSNQTVFLSFYRNSFLHSLFPLEDVLLWIRNILFIFAIGLSSAEFTYKQRRRRYGILVVVSQVVIIAFFSREAGSFGSLLLGIITFGVTLGSAIFTLKNKEDTYDN